MKWFACTKDSSPGTGTKKLIPSKPRDKKAPDEPGLGENTSAASWLFFGSLGGVGAFAPTEFVPFAIKRHTSP